MIGQNVKLVKLLKQYEESVTENKVLHLELVNTREQTIGKENELAQLRQKWNDAKVLLHFLSQQLTCR